MPAQIIGHITCPECQQEGVPVKESAKRQWATYTCNGCGSQHFARSANADKAIRARMTPAAAARNLDNEEPTHGTANQPAAAPENHEEEDHAEEGREKEDQRDSGFTWWG